MVKMFTANILCALNQLKLYYKMKYFLLICLFELRPVNTPPPPHIETPAAVGEWPRIQTYMYAKRS